MSPEQTDRKAAVLSRIRRKLGQIIFREDNPTTSQEGIISVETVNTKLQTIHHKISVLHSPAHQIDPKSVDQIRQVLSVSGASFSKDSVLTVSSIMQTTYGLTGFRIKEAVVTEDDTFRENPKSTFKSVSVYLNHNPSDGSPRTYIGVLGVMDLNDSYKVITSHFLNDRATTLSLLNTLADTVLASEPAKKI